MKDETAVLPDTTGAGAVQPATSPATSNGTASSKPRLPAAWRRPDGFRGVPLLITRPFCHAAHYPLRRMASADVRGIHFFRRRRHFRPRGHSGLRVHKSPGVGINENRLVAFSGRKNDFPLGCGTAILVVMRAVFAIFFRRRPRVLRLHLRGRGRASAGRCYRWSG